MGLQFIQLCKVKALKIKLAHRGIKTRCWPILYYYCEVCGL